MDKRQKNNLMTTITLIVVLGQFILWIMLLLLDNANRLFLYCKDTAILSFTLLLLNHTLQSVKIVVF